MCHFMQKKFPNVNQHEENMEKKGLPANVECVMKIDKSHWR